MIKLTIDIGNTNTLFCFFSFEKILFTKKIETKEISEKKLKQIFKEKFIFKNLDENLCIISSVVPSVERILERFFSKQSINFFFLRDFIKKFNFKTKVKNKSEIGDDRIVNMLYAKKKFNKSVIVIDFGTATTLCFKQAWGL